VEKKQTVVLGSDGSNSGAHSPVLPPFRVVQAEQVSWTFVGTSGLLIQRDKLRSEPRTINHTTAKIAGR
jgi:hypothetical protein